MQRLRHLDMHPSSVLASGRKRCAVTGRRSYMHARLIQPASTLQARLIERAPHGWSRRHSSQVARARPRRVQNIRMRTTEQHNLDVCRSTLHDATCTAHFTSPNSGVTVLLLRAASLTILTNLYYLLIACLILLFYFA